MPVCKAKHLAAASKEGNQGVNWFLVVLEPKKIAWPQVEQSCLPEPVQMKSLVLTRRLCSCCFVILCE